MRVRWPRVGLTLLVLVLVSACGGDAGPGAWTEEAGHRWRSLNPRGSGGFTRIEAQRLGIQFRYDVAEDLRVQNRVLAEGQGVAVGDVDEDGRPDLFFAGFGGPSALYRNLGGWRYEDITAAAGLALENVMVRGAALVDVDGDRHLDLVLTVHGATNRLLLGDGVGGFREVADSGFEGDRASTTPALADIDGDGDLDLYVANYKTRQVDDLYPPSVLDINLLQRGPAGDLVIPADLREMYDEHYRVEFDGRFVRRFELGEPDELYLNEGGGRFRSVPFPDAFEDAGGARLASAPRDWGLAARFSDWDGDGDPDLYVANDFNSPDGIWLNQGDGTFREVSPEAIRLTSLSSMAVEIGDLDRDGDMDLITLDMLARDPAIRLTQTPSFEPTPDPPGVTGTRIQVNRNAVHLNRGDGTFAEVAWEFGLAASDWTWGALLMDADLDGWEDLLVTTGHVWDQLDGDANARVLALPAPLPADRALAMFPELRQSNRAFRGGPDQRFEDVTDAWGWGGAPDISHGIASGDFDADGDLDVVVTRFSDPPLLYRNEAHAPRVLVRLRGPVGNSAGIGARVRLEGHPAGPQVDDIVVGGSYLSSSEPVVSFAATAGREMILSVDWPDGRRSRIEGVSGNREYEIFHASARPSPTSTGDPLTSGGDPLTEDGEPTVTFFEDVTVGLDHRHVESPYEDRSRQPLLPLSLSRLGPGVTWFDIDSDLDPDLIIGSGRGGSPVVLRNEDGVFDTPRSIMPALAADATSLLPHARPGGGWDLLVGTSAYEAGSPQEAASSPAVLSVRLGSGRESGTPRILAASLPASGPGARALPVMTGPLAQADVDGDGDLDLFVGGRVVPGLYPLAATSRILRNEGGDLMEDDALSAPFANVGLVSDALFTDADTDGDPDLVLAIEWGPIRFFENRGGVFIDATEAWGLGDYTGRWNGVATGDFDEDGRPDLVATAWGDNLEVDAPYSVFHGDFNRDGIWDIVEARRTVTGWVPMRGKDALARPDHGPGIPLLERVTYETFARTPLSRLIGGLDTTSRVDARDLRHMVFLNRGERFEARPLPRESQRSPAFGIAVGDLDGDGHEDLVMAQNFFAGRKGAPRYASGRGLWLRGNGRGAFEPVPGQNSGIAVYGDGRGVALADYDRDGRVDIAVGVNGGATRLLHNRGATPGIRVRLRGPPDNPHAIGAVVRIEYGDGTLGPAREVRSGGGYWSRDESVQTLGLRGTPRRVLVRWPGGAQTSAEVRAEQPEVTVMFGS